MVRQNEADRRLDLLIPAEKLFFSAGIRHALYQDNSSSPMPTAGGAGVLLVGLGQTGKDVLKYFFRHLLKYQNYGSSVNIRSILITAGVEQWEMAPNMVNFVLGASGNSERIRGDLPSQRSIFENFENYLEKELIDLRREVGTDIRCFLIANISECENGLMYRILESLAEKRSSMRDRLAFIMFQSPQSPLSIQYQYAAIREVSHFLQVGVHFPGDNIRDKLLERVYLFDGSTDQNEFASRQIPLLSEALLSFVYGGSRFRSYEASIRSIAGNHHIRTLGVRNLAFPIQELCSYISWKLLQEMRIKGVLLYPGEILSQQKVNTEFKAFEDGSYDRYLEDWLGAGFASQILNRNKLSAAPDENEISRRMIEKTTDFLADVQMRKRYTFVWSGLKFILAHLGENLPLIRNTCQKCIEAVKESFRDLSAMQDYLSTKEESYIANLESCAFAEVSRWNTRNPLMQADRIYGDLFNDTIKRNIFEQIRNRSGLAAELRDTLLFFPVCIPVDAGREFASKDYVWHEYSRYFDAVQGLIYRQVFRTLTESLEEVWNTRVQKLNEEDMLFLGRVEQPSVHLENNQLNTEDKTGILIAPETVNGDEIRRKVFRFTSNSVSLPQANGRMLAALGIFAGWRMKDFSYVSQSLRSYIPDEKFHLDEHLGNAAYFEKILRGMKILRARDLFCEELIMTLTDRNAPIAFFSAFLSGALKWDPTKWEWKIEPILENGEEYLPVDLGNEQIESLNQIVGRENLKSLWTAYERFTVDIPFVETPDGALQHPLHRNHRLQYLEAVISASKSKKTPVQASRQVWLDEQAEIYRDDVVLYDFYRLSQAVIKIL